MCAAKPFVHPYMPNSVPAAERELLDAIGVRKASDLYRVIPEGLRLSRPLNLPAAAGSEPELEAELRAMLAKNKNCGEYLNFLGAGCWQHYVPAVCDEIAGRAEFLTAYCGDTYSDKGKYQAVFEYASMLGELLGFDVVCCPTYDWDCAASSALLMAARITGRKEILYASTLSADRLSHMRNFCGHAVTLLPVRHDPDTGLMDLTDAARKIGDETAGIYFETPSYLGLIETGSCDISALAHRHGALSIMGVDPVSLGVLRSPAACGADIAVGDAQPLGNHLNCGGGMCGFIATRDENRFCDQYPTYLYSIAPGAKEGEFGFGQCSHERTSYVRRDASPDYIGTSAWLAAITSSVYLALMGPQGMRELGETILKRGVYARRLLGELAGVKTDVFTATPFKEFVVNFDDTGKTVAQINQALLERRIFGGKDLSAEFPALGQSALYCVTELHGAAELRRLAQAIKEAIQ